MSISRASIEGGVDRLVVHIINMISTYQEDASIEHRMNDKQMFKAARLIVGKHPHLPLKSLELFFEECLVGSFGPNYNRMDIPTLMQWLQKFEDEYFDMCDEQSYIEHQSSKGEKANYAEIIRANAQGKPVPMPESLEKKLHIKSKEKAMIEDIRLRIIKEHSHLFSTMDAEQAQGYITELINTELIEHGIFNLD